MVLQISHNESLLTYVITELDVFITNSRSVITDLDEFITI